MGRLAKVPKTPASKKRVREWNKSWTSGKEKDEVKYSQKNNTKIMNPWMAFPNTTSQMSDYLPV
jgi:hypothetical protein